jgi:hypothetical protein
MATTFVQVLKEKGWVEIIQDWEYRKGNWFLLNLRENDSSLVHYQYFIQRKTLSTPT